MMWREHELIKEHKKRLLNMLYNQQSLLRSVDRIISLLYQFQQRSHQNHIHRLSNMRRQFVNHFLLYCCKRSFWLFQLLYHGFGIGIKLWQSNRVYLNTLYEFLICKDEDKLDQLWQNSPLMSFNQQNILISHLLQLLYK